VSPGATEDRSLEAVPPDVARAPWYRSPLAGKQATHGIYIEIVVLALILALEDKGVSDAAIVGTVFGAITALVLAELYAYYVGTMIGTGRRPTGDELRATVAGTAASLVATVPPVLLLMLGVVGLIRLESGFTAAKWAGVTVLAVYALAATRRAGLPVRASIVAAALFALLGVGLVLLKQLFH